jgi:hypothetical protein
MAGLAAARRKAADPDDPERVRALVALAVVEPWVEQMSRTYDPGHLRP